MSQPTIVEFDLDRYLRNSKKVDLSGIEWEEIPNHPLSAGDVFCLHYMMDIETHTVIYLRDLLATRVAADPQITAFLSCWVYEELWHGEAFSDFLRSYGIEVPAESKLPDGSTPLPTRPNRWRDLRVRVGVGNGLGIVPTMLGSMLTRDFAAIHMMWGAVNELTTLTGYKALMRRSDHPVLHQLLRKVILDERRHFAFYRAQAKARMQRSPAARRLVRWVLRKLWTPVGAGVKSEEEVDALALYLFGDCAEGREQIRELDRTISEIPGLEGLTILEDYLDAALERAATRAGWPRISPPPAKPSANGHRSAPTHWARAGARED
ncbi:MAG TPA: ferritin-like domain-containing protein [Solirubrobacterales bacterium]|nr:ferritin-like domain-containing protein [Solirubrobacterales bacterium]